MSALKYSEDRLKRMALASGGRVDVGSSVVNASRTVTEIRRPKVEAKQEPEPKPEPKPEPVKGPDFGPVMDMAAATRQAAEAQVRIAEEIAKAVSKELPQLDQERVKRWVFTVNRDTRGLITTIEANAK